MGTDLKGRVLELIREKHTGNVLAAATAIEVPQQTLEQIVKGKVQSPRTDTLQKIAAGFGVTTDWLLSGKVSHTPSVPSAEEEVQSLADIRFAEILHELELPQDARMAYVRCAYTVGVASRVLLMGVLLNMPEGPEKMRSGETPRRLEAVINPQVEAWNALLRWMVEILGKAAARERLIRVAPFAERFYSSYAPRWTMSGSDIIQESKIIELALPTPQQGAQPRIKKKTPTKQKPRRRS